MHQRAVRHAAQQVLVMILNDNYLQGKESKEKRRPRRNPCKKCSAPTLMDCQCPLTEENCRTPVVKEKERIRPAGDGTVSRIRAWYLSEDLPKIANLSEKGRIFSLLF